MKNVLKWIGGIVGVITVIVAISFGTGLLDLAYFRFFAPKKENIRREVFENTKSYTHGKAQDLAKYFEEYSKADANEKESIRQLILMNFAQFDETKITNNKLRSFLVTMRGY